MNTEKIITELNFKAIRSSGPGGQHVNKTASKVEVSFHITTSEGLSEEEKERLQVKISSKITSEGFIKLTCSDSRSQHKNKKLVIDKLITLIKENIKQPKPRKKTKPSKTSIAKRLKSKKNQALKKTNRKPPNID
ncbi:MAG: aminoacyl-tRNA hydrolase [Flavobacteriaceae bacterium]|nr:aminoacyl-tRNA hydrolase [Flavobacteriaceae bacterium]